MLLCFEEYESVKKICNCLDFRLDSFHFMNFS
jgi:hypothetical protein